MMARNWLDSALADSPDRYDLVSSLYGPGATVCWYLTALSCLVSWTLHPKKRASGSIDPDFIALLTLPAVATGHLISQIYAYPGKEVENTAIEDIPAILKLAVALEASLVVTETFMAICVILLLIAIWFRCIKRALLLALLGLFCFSAEGYLLLATPSKHDIIMHLNRKFLWNFVEIFIVVAASLSVLIIFTLALTTNFYVRRPPVMDARRPEPEIALELGSVSVSVSVSDSNVETERLEGLASSLELELGSVNYSRLEAERFEELVSAIKLNVVYEQQFRESRNIRTITIASMVYLLGAFISSILPLSTDVLSTSASGWLSWIQAAGNRLVEDVFPHTNVSVKELDQAVAVLAGATVLGFSIYSAAHAHYRNWLDKDHSKLQGQVYTQRDRGRDRSVREACLARSMVRLQREVSRLRDQRGHEGGMLITS